MKPRHKRFAFIAVGLAGLAVAATLTLSALQDNVSLFYSPTQVANREAPPGRAIRLGGLVENGSLRREDDGLTVHFTVTDKAQTIPITYKGILPDLFREGQGVVAQGKIGADGVFRADEVLAKHDEKYMPPEVAAALKDAEKTVNKAGATLVAQ